MTHFKREIACFEGEGAAALDGRGRFRAAVQAVLSAEFYTTLAAYRRLENVKLLEERVARGFESRLARALAPPSPPAVAQRSEAQSARVEEARVASPGMEQSLAALERRRGLHGRKAEDIHRKLLGISELMTRFLAVVHEQDTMLGDILARAETTARTMHKSNKLLVSADEHAKTYGGLWALFFLALGGLLLFYDLVK